MFSKMLLFKKFDDKYYFTYLLYNNNKKINQFNIKYFITFIYIKNYANSKNLKLIKKFC